MNISAQIKNNKNNSNYFVSLSFDIPIKSQRLAIQKPVSGEFTIRPNNHKKNLKIPLGSTCLSQKRETKAAINCDSYRAMSSRNETKILKQHKSSNKNPQNTTRHSRNLSFSYSKSPPVPTVRSSRESSICGYGFEDTINFKPIKQKIIYEVQDDDIINYSKSSSEIKGDSDKGQQKVLNNQYLHQLIARKGPLKTPPLKVFQTVESDDCFRMSEIKRIQKEAEEEKKNIGVQYIKNRILLQISARKIQRAWRNFQTKKLIHTYSNTLPIKFTTKMKNELQFTKQKKILNVKSCGFKKSSNEMKRQIKQMKNKDLQQDYQNIQIQQKKQTKQNMKNKIKMQQIQKWQQLIRQLRKNSNVEQILQKTQQKKHQIQQSAQKKMGSQQQQIKKSLNRIQKKQTKQQLEQKFKFFKQTSSMHQKRQQNIKINTLKQKQQQNTDIKKQPQTLCQQGHGQQIADKQNQSQNEQNNANRQLSLKIEAILVRLIASNEDSSRDEELENLVDFVATEAVCQAIIDFKKIYRTNGGFIKHFRAFANRQSNNNKESDLMGEKPEGICTNMESIKDYMENFVCFLFDQSPQTIINGLNTPKSRQSNFKQLVRAQLPFPNQIKDLVIPKQFFLKHWKHASQQIYFQKKFEDPQQQKQRTAKLKQITKIFFECIFDTFNEYLDQHRAYGKQGAPHIWQTSPQAKPVLYKSIPEIKPLVRAAFKKLSQSATIFCGFMLEDKRPNISIEMADQIREERMNVLLEEQIGSENWMWGHCRDQGVWVRGILDAYVWETLLLQICFQIGIP